MSETKRVLLADDSSVVRRLISDVLNREDDIEVVRQARHGAEAVEFFSECHPDIVLLDVEMPEMDGVEAARAIRAKNAFVPIIIFSSLTTKGAEATLDALAAGASDCVAKPTGKGHISEAMAHIQSELVPKIRSWVQRKKEPRGPQNQEAETLAMSAVARQRTRPTPASPEVVAVGSSTGGPDALDAFLAQLPADFPLPIVVAQHMPPVFTQLLAERLDKTCALEVREAVGGVELIAGQVWIAPGNQHLKIKRVADTAQLALTSDPPENSCRPSVDVLFRSVANCFKGNALGVVLTGMGKDGLLGCEQICAAGGSVLVQDQASSVVWGMPGVVAKAGLADVQMSPADLGREVAHRVRLSHASAATR